MEPDHTGPLISSPSRRGFLSMATCGMGAVIAGAGIWGLGRAMAPSAEIVAAPRLRVDLKDVPIGEQRKVMFEGKPIFVRHLTKDQVAKVVAFDIAKLPDGTAQNGNLVASAPASLANRTVLFKGIYTVLWGLCPKWGCVPLFDDGNYGGWFCPCGAGHVDVLGRIRMGPVATNMRVPKHSVSRQGILTVMADQVGLSQDEIDRLVFGTPAKP